MAPNLGPIIQTVIIMPNWRTFFQLFDTSPILVIATSFDRQGQAVNLCITAYQAFS